MKKKVRRVYVIGALITAGLMMVFAVVFANIRFDDARESLRAILHTASAMSQEAQGDLTLLCGRIAQSAPPIRVTFLDDEGRVLADSDGSERDMDNHLDRIEVSQALEGGIGESVRLSSTSNAAMMYAAAVVGDNLILRLSYPMREIMMLLWIYIPSLFILLVLLYVFTARFFARFSKTLSGQLDRVQLILTGELVGASDVVKSFYPELRPSVEALCYNVWRLRHDYEQIEREQTLRRDFIANASHELKSPLTSISGFAELISDGFDTTEEKRRLYAECILKESERLRAIVDDMLALARADLDEGKDEADREDIDVAMLAREVKQALAPQANAKGIVFTVSGNCAAHAVKRDVWELLYNLMGNAVCYGKRDGCAEVVLSRDGFAVSDDGIGIAPEHIPMLFERFYRVDKAHSRSQGGTGLGLSIAMAIARKYGWTIRVDSEPGRGSKFTVGFVRAL